jgi:hypothetical protein
VSVDTESFVAALNEDLQSEYQSITQYVNHVATITGTEFLSVIDLRRSRPTLRRGGGHSPTDASELV